MQVLKRASILISNALRRLDVNSVYSFIVAKEGKQPIAHVLIIPNEKAELIVKLLKDNDIQQYNYELSSYHFEEKA